MSAEAGLIIRLAEREDAALWDRFVVDHPQATFFHRYGWARIIENTYGHESYYLIAQGADGEVQGILPLSLIKSPFFGRSLVSTAFTVGGGILAANPAVHTALLEEAARQGQIHNVAYVELRGGEGGEAWSVKDETYAGFMRDISPDTEENLKAIPRKRRADIRKAIKSAEAGHLSVVLDEGIDSFYRLYAASVRNLGTPVMPRRFFEEVLRQFPEETEISVVVADGKPVFGLVSFYHAHAVLPYYGGGLPQARALHAYDYAYWQQMCRAAERGVAQFDFGRSKTGTGAYDYKRHWGFEPAPLRYHYNLVTAQDMPDVNPNNPKFRLMTKVWSRLPLPVANVIGPMLAGNLA